MSTGMTPQQFVAKWSRTALSERAASQEHFLDLCALLGQPTPASVDGTGAEYTFEKGVSVTAAASRGSGGESGFADVWWRGKFAWEYRRKGKHRDLSDAYRQLLQYREALENPPLLVVCDIERTEIHTNFTGTAKCVHAVRLEDLTEPAALGTLRRVFTEPESFKPTLTPEKVTEEVAAQFARLAEALRGRKHDPRTAAHFLMKCMFCLFAEDVNLLRGHLFTRLLESCQHKPEALTGRLAELFARMRTGGFFGVEEIPFFNGGLFDESPPLPLIQSEVALLLKAAQADWGSVEPAVFGTLFERSLDPNTRAQIGAHYTSRDDILLVVEPVVMAPLRREWADVQAAIEAALIKRAKARDKTAQRKINAAVEKQLDAFLHRLAGVRVLDPACGSGNFLYVAIQRLLELEKEVVTFAARPDIGVGLFPQVRPTQLHGIEINPYAAELAQVVIWIGYLQWMRDNGFVAPRDPILAALKTIENRDAILDWGVREGELFPETQVGRDCRGRADWPQADYVVGNPPFLGCRQFRHSGLPEKYIDAMHGAFTLPRTADLCCYWFEIAREYVAKHPASRVGLLATQAIRSSDNREVLVRIRSEHRIFSAWSDRPWILDGASVRVAIIGFTHCTSESPVLDGKLVATINADLTADADIASAKVLGENSGVAFMGDTKGGAFDVRWDEARELLSQPNPTGKSNSEVLAPWMNGGDLTKRLRGMWLIDFGVDRPIADACGYQGPFELIERAVKPERAGNRRESYAANWWLHVEPRPALRAAVGGLPRFIVTPRVAKHRLFSWVPAKSLPDSRVFVFARPDDYFYGMLHAVVHELWTLRNCAWHGVGNDPTYNTTTCFETFPMPWPPGKENSNSAAFARISEAARVLNEQRERWLNPPEYIEPLARAVDAADDFADVPVEARALIRHSAIMAAAAADPRLKKRTLTNLYNERPTWLKLAHQTLDAAVLAAYAEIDPEGEWGEEWAEVWVDSGAGQPLPDTHPLKARREEVEQRVLENLLRLNLARAAAGGG